MTTEGLELAEGNKSDVQSSYKYPGIPQENGNYEEVGQNEEPKKSKVALKSRLKKRTSLDSELELLLMTLSINCYFMTFYWSHFLIENRQWSALIIYVRLIVNRTF